jgi:hypothetical protein
MIVPNAIGLERIRRRDRHGCVGVNGRQRRAWNARRCGLAHRYGGAGNRVPRRPEHNVVFPRSLRACWICPADQRRHRKYDHEYCFLHYIRRTVFFFKSGRRFHSIPPHPEIYVQIAASILSLLPAPGERKANRVRRPSGQTCLDFGPAAIRAQQGIRMGESFASKKHQSYFQTLSATRLKTATESLAPTAKPDKPLLFRAIAPS